MFPKTRILVLLATLVLFAILVPSMTSAQFSPFHLGDTEPDGGRDALGARPAVVYNPVDREYLVAWAGDGTPGQVAPGGGVYVRRVDARSGQPVDGGHQRVGSLAVLEGAARLGTRIDAVYNPRAHEYLLVWSGRKGGGAGPILAQRLDARSGRKLTEQPVEISGGGFGTGPSVAYNQRLGEYLVAWSGRIDGETEIVVRFLEGANAAPLGSYPTRISNMGAGGETYAWDPDVAYSPNADQFVVVWWGKASTMGTHRVYYQRLDAAGSEIGPDDQALGEASAEASFPTVAFNPKIGRSGQYLVVWQQEEEGSSEIRGLQIAGHGAATSHEPLRISTTRGDHGGASYQPAIAARANGTFAVTWSGTDGSDTSGKLETFATQVSSMGVPIERRRIGRLADEAYPAVGGLSPSVAPGPCNRLLAVWWTAAGSEGVGGGPQGLFGRQIPAYALRDGIAPHSLQASR